MLFLKGLVQMKRDLMAQDKAVLEATRWPISIQREDLISLTTAELHQADLMVPSGQFQASTESFKT